MYHKPRGRRAFVTFQTFNCVQKLSDRAKNPHKRTPAIILLNNRNPLHGKKEESGRGEGQSSRYTSSNSAFFNRLPNMLPPHPFLFFSFKLHLHWDLFPFFPAGRLNLVQLNHYCPAELPARQACPWKPAKGMISLREHIKPIEKNCKTWQPRADKVAHDRKQESEKVFPKGLPKADVILVLGSSFEKWAWIGFLSQWCWLSSVNFNSLMRKC